MTDRPQCCGECAWWEPRDESDFGECMVVVLLPASAVTPFDRQMMSPSEGAGCHLFKRKESSDDADLHF